MKFGKVVGELDGAVDGVEVELVLERRRRKAGHDRRADDAVVPGDRACRSVIEAGADAVVVVGPVHVVLDVLLAAPDDLDRVLRLLGDQRRLQDEVELEPAPEAAAEQMIVDAHLARAAGRASSATTVCAMLGICVPTQMSQPSGVTCTVQFIGSMVACARNGFS